MTTEAPKVTYYVRVIDNITGEHITEWDSYEKSTWYYGRCNSLRGGESEFIVEFDIWNNEAAFNAGMYDDHNLDAVNCRMTVHENSTINSAALFQMITPIVFARCTTFSHKEPFVPIRNEKMLTDITGNVNVNATGVIQGLGDHAMVQTKIILPANSSLHSNSRYAFDIAFYYDFE